MRVSPACTELISHLEKPGDGFFGLKKALLLEGFRSF